MHFKSLLIVLLLAVVSLAQTELDDIIKRRVQREIDKVVNRVPLVFNDIDDIPRSLVVPPTYANASSLKLSFFAYEPPELDDLDTFDGVYNVFRAYNLSPHEQANLRERTYHLKADYDDTRARVESTGVISIEVSSLDNGVFDTFVPWTSPSGTGNMTMTVTSLEAGGDKASGTIYYSEGENDMYISDVDDVLKESNTNDVTEFIANTFFRDFKVISGMPEYLSSLAQRGIEPHYVTGLPIVFYPTIGKWVLQNYPRGSFTMRPSTGFDLDSIQTGLGTGSYRREAIVDLMRTFSGKRGIIFGDNYGTSLSSFSGVILDVGIERTCFYLRHLGGEDAVSRISADTGLPLDVVRQHVIVYDSPSELSQRPTVDAC